MFRVEFIDRSPANPVLVTAVAPAKSAQTAARLAVIRPRLTDGRTMLALTFYCDELPDTLSSFRAIATPGSSQGTRPARSS
jgi:hypothetical protein